MAGDSAFRQGKPPDPVGLAQRNARFADLLQAAREGRREALNQIVAEMTPMLWQVARAQGLDRTTCEDIVQDTWLSLLRHLDTIRDPNALIGWLVTVTRREAWRVRDVDRRESTAPEQTLDGADDAERQPDARWLADEKQRVLWFAVQRLPERCRALIRVVAFVERPDYDVVAAALGMPRGSIGPTRGRCLAKLRALLVSHSEWSQP